MRRGGDVLRRQSARRGEHARRPKAVIYRIVRSELEYDPVFVNSFRSHYELGGEPRGVERSSTAVHMGISVYLSQEAAVRTALKWPKIGEYVAHARLTAGHGFNFAQTGQPLRLTLWGDPIKLAGAVADVLAVDG